MWGIDSVCGICGQLLFERNASGTMRVDRDELRRMTEAIRHRGPDSDGYYLSENVGLGMRRLSIIDLETGEQPISNEDGSLWIVYNGEIYNYVELRAELVAKGHVLRTRSDTETIVHLYEEVGPRCVERLNGMFAFALWDVRRRELFLARDRLGIKPLYLALGTERAVFGSELKCLLAAGVSREPDTLALHDYLSLFYVPTPRSAYRAVRKLEPGHWLRLRSDGTFDHERYWDIPFPQGEPAPHASREECVEQIRHLLRESVRRQLRSDVPLGVLLSGGLDSTSVLACMSDLLDRPVRTFSIGFRERSYDELPDARRVAQAFESEHRELVVEPDLEALIPRVVLQFDEPFADYSALPTYLVSQMARQEVTVALSGDGGDEVFAGYPTHYAYRVTRLYRLLPRWVRDRLIAPAVLRLPTSTERISFDYMAKRFVTGADMSFQRGHYWWKVILNETEKASLYTDAFLEQVQAQAGARARDSYEVFRPHFERVRDAHPLNQLLYVDAKTFLLDDCLVKVDRMSMANSLEVRVPLLDHELIEYMARVTPRWKSAGLQTKSLLRDVVRPMLPSAIVRGKKRGFTPPLPLWLKHELREFVYDVLSPARLGALGWFKPAAVRRVVDEHMQGQRDNNRAIWTLVCLVLWYENQHRT